MTTETRGEETTSLHGRAARTAGHRWSAASGRLLVAASALLLAVTVRSPLAAQDSAGGGSGQSGENVVRVLITQSFNAKMDSMPAQITWDDLRKGVAVQFDATPDVAKAAKKMSFVLYAALAQGGEIRQQKTSDPFDVIPTASVTEPDKLLPEKSMIPSGFGLKGTFVVGTVEVPQDELLSKDMKGILQDLSSDTPILYLLAAPADKKDRAMVKSAPLTFTMQKASPAPAGG